LSQKAIYFIVFITVEIFI